MLKSVAKTSAKTGAERIRAMRARERESGSPAPALFDRVLRAVIVENVANTCLSPAAALALTRERLVRRGYAVDGVNKTIARMAGESA
jgi:hypothetical protein